MHATLSSWQLRQQISGSLLTHCSHPKCNVGRSEVSRFQPTAEVLVASQLIFVGLIETERQRPTWRSQTGARRSWRV